MSVNAGQEGGNTQGQNGTGGIQPQEPQQQTQGQQDSQQQNLAPYSPYLEKLPESVRGLVEPVFKEWDTGVSQRFQQLHSQYAWAQPWGEIAEQYDPETVSQSLQVFQALNTDPQGFYSALGEAYGLTPAEAQQVVEQGQQGLQQGLQQGQQNGQEYQPDPRFSQLEQTVGTLAELILGQQQQQQESQQEQEFYAMLDGLKQQHGDFDPDYVITKIAAGVDPQQAVLNYRALIGAQAQQLNSPGAQAPVIMGSGGGVPTSSVDIKSLGRKDTQELVASILSGNNKQG